MVVHSHPYLDARGVPQIASTRNHPSTRFWASRHTHSLPHLSTLAHKVLGTQTMDGLPRFRQSLGDHDFLWAVRHYSGHPHIIVEAHELLWVAMLYYGLPQDFLSVHAIVLAVHEKLWTLIRNIWASRVYRSALPRVTGGLTRYLLGTHETSWACMTVLLGRPHATLCASTHVISGVHDISWIPITLAWLPTKKLEPHAFCWATTWTLLGSHVLRRGCGCHARWHPCTYTTRIVGVHDCVWARVSAHLHGWARICTRTHECGHAYTLYGRTRVRNGNNPLPKG